MPERIQMSRQRPWRADHPDAVIVARPSKFGNPYIVRRFAADEWAVGLKAFGAEVFAGAEPTREEAAALVVELFKEHLETRPLDLSELRGRDLACWCPLSQPCHGDVLLELANPGPLCPECVQGKHGNCIQQTLDADDNWVSCGCPEHGGAQ